jgi:hypothetical protein
MIRDIYTIDYFLLLTHFGGSTQVLCIGDPPGRVQGGSFGGVSETNGVSVTWCLSCGRLILSSPSSFFPINDNKNNNNDKRLHHPDTKANASEAERARAEERSKLITNAYQMIKASLKR